MLLGFIQIHSVWGHQRWATVAALLSFLFDMVGGGDITRLTIVCTVIAEMSPPEQL